MGKSQSLRAVEAHDVHLLCMELVELRTRPAEQDRHMLKRLCDLLGAPRGASFCWDQFSPSSPRLILRGFEHFGWEDPERQRFVEFVDDADFRKDVVIDSVSRITAAAITCCRRDLIPSDYDWSRACELGDGHGVASVSDLVGCMFRHWRSDRVSAFALHRLRRDRPFSPKAITILELFNANRKDLYRRGHFGVLMERELTLTEAEQQVCELLLRGWSPTRIANRLHRAVDTIRTQIKAIHKKLDIRSQHDLVQRFCRPRDEWVDHKSNQH